MIIKVIYSKRDLPELPAHLIYLDLQFNNRIAFIAPIKNALHVQSPFVFWSASLFGIRMPRRCQADIAILT